MQRFRELLYKIPNMTGEESYTLLLRGLKVDVKTSVGVNVPTSLEAAISCAQCVDLWQLREGAEQEDQKASKRKQKGKLGNISGEPGPSGEGRVIVVQGNAQQQNPGGQKGKSGGKGKQKGRQQRRQNQQQDQKSVKCFLCGEGHPMKECAQWKQVLALAKKKPQGNA